MQITRDIDILGSYLSKNNSYSAFMVLTNILILQDPHSLGYSWVNREHR